MTDDRPRTLARAQTSRGELALRVRDGLQGPVHELIVAGVFAMDDAEMSTEIELARAGLTGCANPRRVLVGGLGLGHTTLAVLADERVVSVTVVEIEDTLVAWAREGLVPTLTRVAADPRVHLVAADVGDHLGAEGAAYDAILLDVDNGPSFLVHQHNAGLYAETSLRAMLRRVAPGGILAIWAAQLEPGLLARLTLLAAGDPGVTVEERVLPIEREGRSFDYAIYVVSRIDQR